MIKPSRDPRLVGYLTVAIILTIGALAFGRPVLFVCAAPFALASARGLRDRSPIDLSPVFEATDYSPLEGDEVTVMLRFRRRRDHMAAVRVLLPQSWEAVEPTELQWNLPPDGSEQVELSFVVRPVSWGRLSLGALTIDLQSRGGLTTWEVHGTLANSFRVLPPPERVRELLPPPESNSWLGLHPSRTVGDGFDFAELRPYGVGDRVRDVNWRASARFDTLQVNRRHPERNGEVILLLDLFTDVGGTHSTVLQAVLGRSARAAWSIAQLHLNSQDRVGLVSRAGFTRQLATASGDRARYTLLETLLDIGGEIADGRPADGTTQRLRIPTGALVVAFTPLTDARMTRDLLALRGAGRSVVVVNIDVMDLLPAPTTDHEAHAYRMFAMQVNMQRDRLAAEGIPTTVWRNESSLGQVVAALRHLQRVRMVRR
jgi:uncharacterized protein (DUF58 family)